MTELLKILYKVVSLVQMFVLLIIFFFTILDLISNDSDAECSQSVCSDTHSDNTSASGLTEKSTLSESTIHALSGGSEAEGIGAATVSPGI